MPQPVSTEAVLLSHLLNLFAVPAYVTDGLNRIRAVSRAYAALVGDPIRDGLQGDDLFVHSLILGTYRDHFPRRHLEVAACAPSLAREIAAGHLAARSELLLRRALGRDEEAARQAADVLAGETGNGWDGLVLIQADDRRPVAYSESVVPLTNLTTRGALRYLNLWTRPGARAADERAGMLLSLTPREREAAALYASGLNATEVAASLGISVHTAHDHRDSIYDKLGIHSRAELGRVMGSERA